MAALTDAVVAEVLQRRESPNKGGFYTSNEDFWGFVNAKGGRVAKDVMEDTPLIFTAVTNFKIQSIGEYKGAIRQIDAVVFDLGAAATVIADRVKKEVAEAQNPGGPTPTPTPQPAGGAVAPAGNQTATKGPPRIVYWNEK